MRPAPVEGRWRLYFSPLVALAFALLFGALFTLAAIAQDTDPICIRSATPELKLLKAIANATIGVVYLGITAMTEYLMRLRPDLYRRGMVIHRGYQTFIAACGIGHFFVAVGIWAPLYLWAAAWDSFTAVVSVFTLAILTILPALIMGVPNPEELEEANAEMKRQLAEYGATVANYADLAAQFQKVRVAAENLAAAGKVGHG